MTTDELIAAALRSPIHGSVVIELPGGYRHPLYAVDVVEGEFRLIAGARAA